MSGRGRRGLPRGHPATLSGAALVLRALATLVMFELAGAAATGRRFTHLDGWWIAVVVIAELLTYGGYVLLFESVARFGPEVHVRVRTAARIVIAGFGPLAASGGFGIDRMAWRALEGDETQARLRVAAVATLEWAVLTPIACVVAIVAIATDAGVPGSMSWPWAILVPAGFLLALWATDGGRPERLARPRGRLAPALGQLLMGLRAVRTMTFAPRRYAGAWAGMALYWTAEICAFYAALRAAGLSIGAERAVLAYATGYLVSRRSLPLGGAGLTELLLLYALYALHEPLAPSVVAIVVYRAFSFGIVTLPALVAYRGLEESLASSEAGAAVYAAPGEPRGEPR